MRDEKNGKPSAPEIGPYVFPTILAALGIWCFYDGWLTSNPEMQEHTLFNQIASLVLLIWAAIDIIRTRRAEKKSKN